MYKTGNNGRYLKSPMRSCGDIIGNSAFLQLMTPVLQRKLAASTGATNVTLPKGKNLFHGTAKIDDAKQILGKPTELNGIEDCCNHTQLGNGFYTTATEGVAIAYAADRASPDKGYEVSFLLEEEASGQKVPDSMLKKVEGYEYEKMDPDEADKADKENDFLCGGDAPLDQYKFTIGSGIKKLKAVAARGVQYIQIESEKQTEVDLQWTHKTSLATSGAAASGTS